MSSLFGSGVNYVFPKSVKSQKDLIKRIRKCKTAAQERQVIAKEAAAIRSCIKEDLPQNRATNVSKLLYLHLHNFPTQYGQVECLKVAASQILEEKKLGYLAVSLLIDSSSPLLTLVTNCLKGDLGSEDEEVIGVALTALASINGKMVLEDLSGEICRLTMHSAVNVRKRAFICATKLIQMIPDMAEMFIGSLESLMLHEKNHAVLMGGFTLFAQMLQCADASVKSSLRRHIGAIVVIVKAVAQESYFTEYEVDGVPDPFLLTLLIRCLRLLLSVAAEDPQEDPTNQISDCLAYTVGVIDDSLPGSNSILYEVVKTILEMPVPDHSMVSLGINTLAKFVGNSDNNLRYVALDLLGKFAKIDVESVQKHREMVSECLKDQDPSIRRVSLHLLFELLEQDNYQALIGEICSFFLEGAGCTTEDSQWKVMILRKLTEQFKKFIAKDPLFFTLTMLDLLGKSPLLELDEEFLGDFMTQVQTHVPKQQLKNLLNDKMLVYLQEGVENDHLLIVAFHFLGKHPDYIFDQGELLRILEKHNWSQWKSSLVKVYFCDCIFQIVQQMSLSKSLLIRFLEPFTGDYDSLVSQKAFGYLNLDEKVISQFVPIEKSVQSQIHLTPEALPVFECEEFAIFCLKQPNNPLCGNLIFVFLMDSHCSRQMEIEGAVPTSCALVLSSEDQFEFHEYGQKINLSYKITAPEGKNVKLKVKCKFELCSSQEKTADSVTVNPKIIIPIN